MFFPKDARRHRGITMNVRTATIAMQNSESRFGSSLLCALLCDRLSGLLLGAVHP